MTSIIVKPLNGEACIAADDFTVVELDQTIPPTGKVLVNIAVWQAEKDALKARAQAGELGVWLNPEDNPELLAQDVSLLPVVAFHFPVFKFGQGYSGAVLLRSRYGFQGDIRAYGDIWRDQLFYLARCGFTQLTSRMASRWKTHCWALRTLRCLTKPVPMVPCRFSRGGLHECTTQCSHQ